MVIIFQGDPGAVALSKFLLLNPAGVAIVVVAIMLTIGLSALAAYAVVTDGALGI
jgi:hypothetical protein